MSIINIAMREEAAADHPKAKVPAFACRLLIRPIPGVIPGVGKDGFRQKE